MSETIRVGSRWRDNDERMARVVVVEKVAGDFVWYSGAILFTPNFLKAFTCIDVEPSRDSRAEVIEKLEKAHKELCEAVQRQWDGGHALNLSIPARPDRDTDLVIGGAIREALALLRKDGR